HRCSDKCPQNLEDHVHFSTMCTAIPLNKGNTIMSPVLWSAGHELSPRGFWFSWPNEPMLLIGLALVASLYWRGWVRLGSQAPKAALPIWRVVCFAGGLLSLFLSLLSPIASYSEK